MNSGSARDESSETRRRKSLGRAGEKVARDYLAGRGYRIIATNYRKRFGEVDIIAMFDPVLVFIEVKTRVGLGNAIEGYSEIQMARMVEASRAFIIENEKTLPCEFDLRYDLVIVGKAEDGSLAVQEHIKEAFHPE